MLNKFFVVGVVEKLDKVTNDYTTVLLNVPIKNKSKKNTNYLIPFYVPATIIKSLSKNIIPGNTIVIAGYMRTNLISKEHNIELVADELKFLKH